MINDIASANPPASEGPGGVKELERTMKTTKTLLYLILLASLFCTSCQPVIRLLAGVKNPRFENPENIRKTAEELSIPLQELYVFAIDSLCKDFDSTHFHLDVVDRVLCFNKDGYLLLQDTNLLRSACVIPGSNFVDLLFTVYKVDSSMQLKDYLQTIKRVNAQKQSAKQVADITMVYHWGIWYKGMVKRRLNEINEVLTSKNDSIKVEVLYVNTDLNKEHYEKEFIDKNTKVRFRY